MKTALKSKSEDHPQQERGPDSLDLRRFSIFFEDCIGPDCEVQRNPTLHMIVERTRAKLATLFDVDNLSTIEAAWLRHVTIKTLHYYNHHKDQEAQGEISRFTLKTAPFNEIAMAWVMELYRPDFISCGELHLWRDTGTISDTFKRDLRLQRDLAHKL